MVKWNQWAFEGTHQSAATEWALHTCYERCKAGMKMRGDPLKQFCLLPTIKKGWSFFFQADGYFTLGVEKSVLLPFSLSLLHFYIIQKGVVQKLWWIQRACAVWVVTWLACCVALANKIQFLGMEIILYLTKYKNYICSVFVFKSIEFKINLLLFKSDWWPHQLVVIGSC